MTIWIKHLKIFWQASRDNWVDEVKGILILSVILGHSIISVNAHATKNHIDLNLYMSYAYVFVLSGYVLKVEDNPNILGFANRKLKRLMLPYILFIVINTTMEAFLHIYSLNEIKKKILSGYFPKYI